MLYLRVSYKFVRDVQPLAVGEKLVLQNGSLLVSLQHLQLNLGDCKAPEVPAHLQGFSKLKLKKYEMGHWHTRG